MRFTRLVPMSLLMAALGVSWVDDAEAQSFGRQGDVSFAGERVMGVYFADDDAGADGLTLGLGVPALGGLPYTLPRVGFDVFIIDQLSLGGSVGIWETNGDRGLADGFLVHPRIGYAVPLGSSAGIWPRGGLTFWNLWNDEVALTGEAMFWVTPGDDWGFLFGPTLDIGFAGDHRGDDESLVVGLAAAGIFGWL